MIYIYSITRAKTGRVYIGKTKNLKKRIKRHFATLRLGTHANLTMQKEWIENNLTESDFDVSVVDTANCEKVGRALEELNILNAIVSGNFYNIGIQSRGGDNLTNHPNREEIIEKIKVKVRANFDKISKEDKKAKWGRPGDLNPMFGKTHSCDARLAISTKNKGNKFACGSVRSSEQRAILSECAKKRVGALNPFFNKKHTKDSIEKMSMAKKGTKPSNMRKVTANGNIYESVTCLAKELEVTPALIIYRIKSDSKKWERFQYV